MTKKDGDAKKGKDTVVPDGGQYRRDGGVKKPPGELTPLRKAKDTGVLSGSGGSKKQN